MAIVRRAAALCLLSVLCTVVTCREDTSRKNLWPSPVEPRLSRAVLRQPPADPHRCPEIVTHDIALYVLVHQPRCTDAVIAWLKTGAETNEAALADLAAAHYLRAFSSSDPQPSAILDAYEAADEAAARNPRSLGALYNRALILGKLGLTAAAIEAWNRYLAVEDHARWAAQARRHLAQLQRVEATPALWKQRREEIRVALRRRAQHVVAELIEPFPFAAMRFFEDELLRQWAQTPSEDGLAELEIFATALSHRLNGDPYAPEVVRALKATRDHAALREGFRIWTDARTAERSFEWDDLEPQFAEASRLLRSAAGPFHLSADLGAATAAFYRPNPRLPLLDRIDASRYPHLNARLQMLRGLYLFKDAQYLKSLAAYGAAADALVILGDSEGHAGALYRRAGVYQTMGQNDRAWRDCAAAQKNAALITSLGYIHGLMGETANTALALGHPSIALLYYDAFIGQHRRELAVTPPENRDAIGELRRHIAIARANRGTIRVELRDFDGAEEDLSEALRLSADGDPTFRLLMEAGTYELQGRRWLERQPVIAIEAFSEALKRIEEIEQPTFRARLLARRARARAFAGQDAQPDLEAALKVLREEESRLLQSRKRGEGEEIWHTYFARFSDTYAQIIQHRFPVRDAEAFQYAERERAFETVNLILGRDDVSPVFRRLASADFVDIAAARSIIPAGTVLIQYRVLDDRTYAWVLSSDRFVARQLRASRATIERWTTELQEAARRGDDIGFETGLYEPYAHLIAPLFNDIKDASRYVFVPHGAIHGIPLAALRPSDKEPYLIERAPIEIAGSTLLYLYSLLRDQDLRRTAASALLIGNPSFDRTLGLAEHDLPAAAREANKIREFYDPRAEVLTGAEATVPAFLDRAGRYSIIHIAAHAIVNPREPMRSLLLLAPSGAGVRGELEAHELLDKLRLHSTRLVVLSACSSAGGLPVGPEGVAPLVRPLVAAGVPAVIGSLWDVKDAPTESLLVSFHQHFVQGADAATAMQAAQLDMLKAPDLRRSVLTWAPFQVIGHASSPSAATRNGGNDSGTVHSANILQRPHGLHPQ